MTLEQLRGFVAIAEQGGLRAAAKSLNKTQPSLSVAIKALESHLDLRLFTRDSYRMELTAEGQVLLAKAQALLSQSTQLETLAEEFSSGRETQLQLAIDYLCPWQPLMKSLDHYRQSCLSTSLTMDFQVLSGAGEKLIRGGVHLALTPFLVEPARCHYKELTQIKLLPYVRTDLATKNLELLPQIVAKDSAQEQPSKSLNMESPSPKWVVSDHWAKQQLIESGQGWGYLEESSVKELVKSKQLKHLSKVSHTPTTLPLYLARSKESPYGPIAKELWKYLESSF